jgi:hypothetical protein
LGWSDPTFRHLLVAKKPRGRSSPTNGAGINVKRVMQSCVARIRTEHAKGVRITFFSFVFSGFFTFG